MNFLDYQEDLDDIISDSRPEWQPDINEDESKWKAMKKAINYWIRETLNRLSQSAIYKEKNYTTSTLTISNGFVTRPTGMLSVYTIEVGGYPYHDYIDQEKEGKILFPDFQKGEAIIKYIAAAEKLVLNQDVPGINSFFADGVTAYAMERYHLKQEDWDNVARSVAYAEDKIDDLLSKYY